MIRDWRSPAERTGGPVGARVETESYLLWQHLCSQVLQRELETTVAIVKKHLDSNEMLGAGMRGQCWGSHDDRGVLEVEREVWGDTRREIRGSRDGILPDT